MPSPLSPKSPIVWATKDPRMCITLQAWLPLLEEKPVIIFVFRQPLQVAKSVSRREKMGLPRSLYLWMAYNKAAIKNSESLCRIVVTDEDLLNRTEETLAIIKSDLENHCGLRKGIINLPSTEDLVSFVDPSIRQHKSNSEEQQKKDVEVEKSNEEKEFFLRGKSICVNDEYLSRKYIAVTANAPEGSHEYDRERKAYLKSMRLYCDMVNRKAFDRDYYLEILPDYAPP